MSPATLLVIDDEKNIRGSVRNFMEDFDFRILEAANGREGLEIVRAEHPDIVLVDLMMPVVDGFQVLEEMQEKFPEIPAIVVSGTGVIRDVVRALRLGAWDYLIKPVEDLYLLKHVIDSCLQRSEIMQENRRHRERLEQDVSAKSRDLHIVNRVLRKEIEERKRTEKALERSERILDSIIRQVPDIIYRLDTEGNISFINEAIRAYGYEPSEVVGRSITQLVHPDDRERVCYQLRERRTGERHTRNLEVRLVRHDRKTAHLEMRSVDIYEDPVVLVEAEGLYASEQPQTATFLGTQGIARDISERKRTEDRLRQSEARYRALVEGTGQPVFQLDADGNYLFINQAASSLGEYPIDYYVGRNIRDVHTPKHVDFLRECIEEALSTGKVVWREVVMEEESGNRWFDLRIHPLSWEGRDPSSVLGIALDKTERYLTEIEMRHTRALFHAALEQSQTGILVVNAADERVILVNSVVRSIFRLPADQQVESLDGEDFKLCGIDGEVIPPSELPWYLAVRDGQVTRDREFQLRLDDEVTWLLVNAAPIRSEDGGIEAAIVIMLDISRRMRVEEERRRLTAAIEQAAERIIIFDTNQQIRYVNPAFLDSTGFTREEVLGQTHEFINGSEESAYPVIFENLRQGRIWHGRLTTRHQDGSQIEEEATFTPVLDRSGRISNFVGVKRDVTRQAILERQLRQSQKMEAIGTLAGGIAHDFNNILSVIFGFVEMSRLSLKENDPVWGFQMEISKAAERARELVQQILTFSRQKEKAFIAIHLQHIIKESLNFLRASIPRNIEIKTDIDSQCGTVLADPTQMHQVLMNLCTNAYHAMRKKGGRLFISLQRKEIRTPEHHIDKVLEPGNWIVLEISDTGHGMEKSVMERIFDPYFTTKDKGEGTGLGLAVVHGIIKAMDGTIEVESQPGLGTTFRIHVPEIAIEAQEIKEQSFAQLPGGNEHIMIIDDEPQIVIFLNHLLRRLGYSVEAYSDSEEALGAFLSNPYRYDLVITDMHMPKLTGEKLATGMFRQRNDIPVILCTGHSDVIDEDRALKMGIEAFVLKPIVHKEMAATIRKVLDGKR